MGTVREVRRLRELRGPDLGGRLIRPGRFHPSILQRTHSVSMMTIGNKSGAVKDLLKKSNRMYVVAHHLRGLC